MNKGRHVHHHLCCQARVGRALYSAVWSRKKTDSPPLVKLDTAGSPQLRWKTPYGCDYLTPITAQTSVYSPYNPQKSPLAILPIWNHNVGSHYHHHDYSSRYGRCREGWHNRTLSSSLSLLPATLVLASSWRRGREIQRCLGLKSLD